METYGISFSERKREFRIIFPATGEENPNLITSLHITCPRKPVVGAEIDAFGFALEDEISGFYSCDWYEKDTADGEYQIIDRNNYEDFFAANHYYMFKFIVSLQPYTLTLPEDESTVKCYARYSFLEDYFLLTGVVHAQSRDPEAYTFSIELYDCLPDPAE